ncbi:hypothetical protein P3S68_031349 [Capsicum galapagoense]
MTLTNKTIVITNHRRSAINRTSDLSSVGAPPPNASSNRRSSHSCCHCLDIFPTLESIIHADKPAPIQLADVSTPLCRSFHNSEVLYGQQQNEPCLVQSQNKNEFERKKQEVLAAQSASIMEGG